MNKEKETKDANAKTQAIVPAGSTTALALPTDMEGIFDPADNMEGIKGEFPVIKIVHQGQMYTMPDDKKVESFEGHIIDKNLANAYWITPFTESGGNEPPDCTSPDAITPDELSSGDLQANKCADCPKNQFETAKEGKGKACKNMRLIHVLLDGEKIPYRLAASAANLKPTATYFQELTMKGIPFPLARTKFSLKAVKNSNGIEYSEIVMEPVGMVSSKDAAMLLKKMQTEMKPIMRSQPVMTSGDSTGHEPEPQPVHGSDNRTAA